MGENGNNQSVVEEQKEKVDPQTLEREQEEEADELDIVRQQRVAIPQAAVEEEAPIGAIRRELTNKGGVAGGNEDKDANFQGMLQGMEALEQMLRQTVPETKAQQKQIAGNLRKSCSAIMQNANSYIQSRRLSVSKSARESRRLAQEVSMKCQNVAKKLYIIMDNAAIQGQITWEQVLGQTADGARQQPANNTEEPAVPAQAQAQPANNAEEPAVPPRAQAQPANNAAAQIAQIQAQLVGMQLPRAETAKDFEIWESVLKTSEKGGIGFGNSKYFNRVLFGVRKVGRALKERFGKVLNDNIEKLGAAREALQSLLEACMSYTARNPRTAKGKARKRLVEQLQEYAAQDVKGCSDAMDAFFRMSEEEMEHETWKTVLQSARSVKVNVQDFSQLQAPEAGMSSEIVKIETKTGIKYFKREDSTDLDEFKDSDNMARDIAMKETLAKFGKIPEEDMQHLPRLIKSISFLTEKDFEGVSREGKPILKHFTKRYKQLDTNIGLFSMLNLYDKGGKINLSRRNVATSRIASLLELEGLIAESQTAEVYDQASGETIHGNLMNQAEGKEYDDVKNNLKERKIKPSFLREITNLQVLDMLCGQIDRHSGNMMYKVDTEGNITGVQGIDNDASFGLNTDPKNRGASVFDSSNEEMLIPYMDAGLANRIIQLDGRMLRYVLIDLLKEDEINMAIKRLEGLQKGIKNVREKEANRFLEKDEDWTLHENHNEALENIRGRGFDSEQENPELADKNRGQGRSVEYNFYYAYAKNNNRQFDVDEKRKMAKKLFEKSDPNRLKLLLQFYVDRNAFRKNNKTKVVKEIEAMNTKVVVAITKMYKQADTYFSYAMRGSVLK